MKNKKGELDIPFGWLFGLIVGAIILSLAIFMASKLMNTEKTNIDSSVAKEIGVLMNPLQLGIEDYSQTHMEFPVNTRIYTDCNQNGEFGKQTIKVSQKFSAGWSDSGVEVNFNNIHIFSKEILEGKKFTLFSQKFEFPYKVADAIYMISEKEIYCFVNPPENVASYLQMINLKNVVTNCSKGNIRVCFDNSRECNISVRYNEGSITKDGKTVFFYDDTLMYAGIFSDPIIYECQLKRLMKKASSLALLYNQKASIIARAGCNSNLNADLSTFASSLTSMTSSSGITSLSNQAEKIGQKNDYNSDCRLW